MTECSEQDCSKPLLAKGLCRNHYYRLKRNGHTGLQDRGPKPCSIEGCQAPSKSRGMCSKHYQQWRTHGEIKPDREQMSFSEWFWSRVAAGAPDECWPWRDGCYSSGYGSVRHGDTTLRTHRVAYSLANGEIPTGLEVDHTCHDPQSCRGGDTCPHRRCCNPAHLVAKSHRDNCAADRTILAVLNRERRGELTACPQGHRYDEANTYVSKGGKRHCRACNREKAAESRERKKQSA